RYAAERLAPGASMPALLGILEIAASPRKPDNLKIYGRPQLNATGKRHPSADGCRWLLTGLGSRRAEHKSFTIPGVLKVDQRIVEQRLIMRLIDDFDAFAMDHFVVCTRFIQNHSQAGTNSAEALPD
ncbi:MAG: hypothetical protein KFF50_13105, partial [Desulfatitalea sp.]|nr:hypothetical protein [Desulfatitalea sp.]